MEHKAANTDHSGLEQADEEDVTDAGDGGDTVEPVTDAGDGGDTVTEDAV
jgi:hypothetical protein